MKKTLFLSLFFICAFNFSFAQLTFQSIYSAGFSTHPVKIIKSLDGNMVMAGNLFNNGGPIQLYITKVNLSGSPMWSKLYDDSFGQIVDIALTLDSGFILTGVINDTSFGTSSWEAFLMKIDAGGNLDWIKSYYGYNGVGESVCQTADGGYFITGTIDTASTQAPFQFLIKTDSIGNIIWQKRIRVGLSNYWSTGIQIANGDYFISGISAINGGADSSLYLIRMDNFGNIIWYKEYAAGMVRSFAFLKYTNDGGFLISSQSGIGSILIKTDLNGDTIWSKHYNISLGQNEYTIDSNFIFLCNGGLMKTDSIGNVMWVKDYNHWDSQLGPKISVAQALDGTYFVLGYYWQFVNCAYFHLSKTDSQGGICYEYNSSVIIGSVPFSIGTPAIFEFIPVIYESTPALSVQSYSNFSVLCSGVNIRELESENSFSVFSNPFTYSISIQFFRQENENASLRVFNKLGQVMLEKKIEMIDQTVIVPNLSAGIYLVTVSSSEGVFAKKIIK